MRRGDGEILGIASQYRRRASKGSQLFRSVFVFLYICFCLLFLFCLFFLLLAWVLAEHAVFILLSIAWECIQAVLTISYLLCYYISLLSFYSITLCPLLFLFYSWDGMGWDGHNHRQPGRTTRNHRRNIGVESSTRRQPHLRQSTAPLPMYARHGDSRAPQMRAATMDAQIDEGYDEEMNNSWRIELNGIDWIGLAWTGMDDLGRDAG